ncbi:MAG: AAC(3) family N-acetyltransferase [Planctomycetes bacterium]|nr:AAC(3) family N-acetyltransferase [Planctomycetota bacterium]
MLDRVVYPVTAADIARCLESLVGGVQPIIFMHSSLSRCGYIEGGPATIVQEVKQWCDTLCVPTHTYCYVRPDGSVPVYEPRMTKSVVGEITNFFWEASPQPIRSIHPTHSIAAAGPSAEALVEGHVACDTPCGRGTPYEHFIAADAAVLMFGASMHSYTLFHTAEDAAECPYLYFPQPVRLRALDYAGILHEVVMRRQDMTVERRFAETDRELEQQGLLRRAKLGKGEIYFVPSSRAVHAFLLDRLKSDPHYLVDRRASHRI